MQKNESIKKNYILNTIYQVLALMAPLITAPYVSRVLRAEGVGIYSYTISLVSLFSIFAVLGTTTYGQRVIAQCRDNEYLRSKNFWEIEITSLCATMLCLIIWIIFSFTDTKGYQLYYLILSIEIISVGFDITWLYTGLEKFVNVVIRNSIIKINGIILLFLLVKTSSDLWIYISILSISKLLGNLSMWMTLGRFIIKVPFHELRFAKHLKETFAYFIPTAAASVYTYLDKIMIGTLTSSTVENGYYEQTNKIIKIGYTIIVSLNTVMSSRMSYLFALNKEAEIKSKLEKSIAFIFTFSMPMVFGIAAISKNLVPWFFGDDFDKVSILLVVAAPLILIMSMHNFLSAQYLVPSGQRVRSTKGVIVGANVNLLFNLLLIPRLYSLGAVIATVIAESSIFFVYLHMSKDYIPGRLILRYVPKQLFAAIIMFFVVYIVGCWIPNNILATVIQICVGAVIYFLILLLLQEKFTLSVFKSLLKKFIKTKS